MDDASTDMPLDEKTNDLDEAADKELDEAIESFLVQVRRGERPSIDACAARHPRIADAIRHVFPTLLLAEDVAGAAAAAVGAGGAFPPGGDALFPASHAGRGEGRASSFPGPRIQEFAAAFGGEEAQPPRASDQARHLADTLCDMGEQLARRGKLGEARELLEWALAHREAAVQSCPGDRGHQESLCACRARLCAVLSKEKDHKALAQRARELSKLRPGRADDAYQAACLLARCAAFAAEDSALAEADRAAAARAYADEAVALLRECVRRGFADAERMRSEGDLASLRDRGDFREILEGMRRGEK
jgi:hypothetical protein